MKTILSLLTGAFLCSTTLAQHCIVRQSSGQSTFYYHAGPNAYTTLVQAFSDANTGDTLHLPGTTYTITSELVINKRLVIIGTGIDPDSTIASGRTTWTTQANITITNTADSLELHGIVIDQGSTGFIRYGTDPASSGVDGVKFIRCTIAPDIRMSGTSSGTSLSTNTLFEGCILFGNLQVRYADPTVLRNCILPEPNLFYAGTGTLVENCILHSAEQGTSGGTAGVIYRHCVFLRSQAGIFAPAEQSTYENNLWVLQSGGTLDLSGVLNATGNDYSSLIGSVFQTPLPSFNQFDWSYNYHLISGSPYETMGIGNTPVGIYGGGPLSAWKDGALPFNPHWDQFSAPGATTGGVLQGVQLRGTAQTH